MPTLFLSSLVFCLVVSILGVIFMVSRFILVSTPKKNIYLIWMFGFLLFALSYIIEIYMSLGSIGYTVWVTPSMRPYREIVKLAGCITFVWGTFLIATTENFLRVYLPLILLLIGIVHLITTGEGNIFIISSAFKAIAFLIVSYFFSLLYSYTKSYGSAILTIYFFLTTAHYTDYFFLRKIGWYAPFGFFLYGIFLLIIIYGFWQLGREKEEVVDKRVFNTSLIIGVINLIFMIVAILLIENFSIEKNEMRIFFATVPIFVAILPVFILRHYKHL